MISWVIQNEKITVEQHREQAENYLDKVSTEQSKYIALHVGIFWGIGTFIIKNGDAVKIMLDSPEMYDHLSADNASTDPFVERRTGFIKQLIEQRKLVIKFELIQSTQNMATKALSF